MRDEALKHRFVESFPKTLDPGVLYVSLEYGSVAHSCCCGCGEEVVTPLTPTDWSITYDGETVTLDPSVGSWTLPCRSHYVIRRGRVIEAPSWSDAEIAAERRRDRQAKALYFNQPPLGASVASIHDPQFVAGNEHAPPQRRWWQRLSQWWRDRKR